MEHLQIIILTIHLHWVSAQLCRQQIARGDNAGSKFRFHYKGTTNRNPNVWSVNYGADGFNDIGFYNNGDSGIIAETKIIYNPSTLNISETDTTLNVYHGFTTVGAAGMYDVQNTMTHEFGHWLFLKDIHSIYSSPSWCEDPIYNGESTMCVNLWAEETRNRTLEIDDKNGIKAIYGI